MENFWNVEPIPNDTAVGPMPKHKAVMICATASDAIAQISFWGSKGEASTSDTEVRVPAHTTLILPIRIRATGALTNCTVFALN